MSISDAYGDSSNEKICNYKIEYTGCNSDDQISTYLQETKEARILQYLDVKFKSSTIGDLMMNDFCTTPYDKDNKLELSKLKRIVSSYKNNLIKISESRISNYDEREINVFTFLDKVLAIIYNAVGKTPPPNIYDAIQDPDTMLNITFVVKGFIDTYVADYVTVETPTQETDEQTGNELGEGGLLSTGDEYDYSSDYRGYDIRGDQLIDTQLLRTPSVNWERYYSPPENPKTYNTEIIYEIYNPPTRSLYGGLFREYYPKSPYHNGVSVKANRESRKYLYNTDHSRLNSWHSWITANNLIVKPLGIHNFKEEDISDPANISKRSDFSTFGFHYMEKELEQRFSDLNGANISNGGVEKTSCDGEPSWATSTRYNHLSEPTDYTNFDSYNGGKLDGDYCTDLNGCFNNSLTIRYNPVYRGSSPSHPNQERGGRDLEKPSSDEVFMKVVGLVTQGKGESVNQYENSYFAEPVALENTDSYIRHLKSRSLPHEPEYENSFDALANPWTGYSNYVEGSPSPVYGISGVNNSCGEPIYGPNTSDPNLIPYADNDGYLMIQGFCSEKDGNNISKCKDVGEIELATGLENINIILNNLPDFGSVTTYEKAIKLKDEYGLDGDKWVGSLVATGEPEPQNSINIPVDLEHPDIDISKPKLYYYSKGLEDGSITESYSEPLCITLNKNTINVNDYKHLIILTTDEPDATYTPTLLIPDIDETNKPVKKYRYSTTTNQGVLGNLYNIHFMYGRPWTTDQQLIDNIEYVEGIYTGLEEENIRTQIYGLLQLLKSQYYWEGWFAMKEYVSGKKNGEKIIWAKNEIKTNKKTPPTDGWHLNPHLFENNLKKFIDDDNDDISIYDYDYIYEDDNTGNTLKNIVNEYYNNNNDDMLWFYEGSLKENLQSLMSLQNNTGSSQTNSDDSDEYKYDEIVQKLDRLYYRRNYLNYKIKSGGQNFQGSLDDTMNEMDQLSSKLKDLINEPDFSGELSEPVYNAYLNKELNKEDELTFLGSEPSYHNDFQSLGSKNPPFSEPCFEPSPDNLLGFNFDRDNFDFNKGFQLLYKKIPNNDLECSEPSDGEPSYICPYPGGREALFLGCGDQNIYCHRPENSYGYDTNTLPTKTTINTYEQVSCAPGFDLDTSEPSEPYLTCEPIDGFSEYKLFGCKQEKLLNLYKCRITFKINFTPVENNGNPERAKAVKELTTEIEKNILELKKEELIAKASLNYRCKVESIQILINNLKTDLAYYSKFSTNVSLQSGVWKSFSHKNTNEDMFKVSFNNSRAGLNGISEGDICYSSNTSNEITQRNGSHNYSNRPGSEPADDLSTDMGCSRDSMYFQLFKTPLVTDQVKIFPYNKKGLLQHVRVGLLVEKKRKGGNLGEKYKLKNSYGLPPGDLSTSEALKKKKYYIRSLFTDTNIEGSTNDKDFSANNMTNYDNFSSKVLGCYKKRTGLWRRIESDLLEGEGIRFHEKPDLNPRQWNTGYGNDAGANSPKIRNNFIDGRLQHSDCGSLDKLAFGNNPTDGHSPSAGGVRGVQGCFLTQDSGKGPTSGEQERGPQLGTYKASYSPYYEYRRAANLWYGGQMENIGSDYIDTYISMGHSGIVDKKETDNNVYGRPLTSTGYTDSRYPQLNNLRSPTGNDDLYSTEGPTKQHDPNKWRDSPKSKFHSTPYFSYSNYSGSTKLPNETKLYNEGDMDFRVGRVYVGGSQDVKIEFDDDGDFRGIKKSTRNINNYVNYANGDRWDLETKKNGRDRHNITDNGTILDFNSEWEIHQGPPIETIEDSINALDKGTDYVKYGIPFELKTDFDEKSYNMRYGNSEQLNKAPVATFGMFLGYQILQPVKGIKLLPCTLGGKGTSANRYLYNREVNQQGRSQQGEGDPTGLPKWPNYNDWNKDYSQPSAPVDDDWWIFATIGRGGVPNNDLRTYLNLSLDEALGSMSPDDEEYDLGIGQNKRSSSYINRYTDEINRIHWGADIDEKMSKDSKKDDISGFKKGYTTGYTIYMFGVRNSKKPTDNTNKTYKTWSGNGIDMGKFENNKWNGELGDTPTQHSGDYENGDETSNHPGFIAKFKRIGVREFDDDGDNIGQDVQPRIPLTAENISKLWNENDYQHIWHESPDGLSGIKRQFRGGSKGPGDNDTTFPPLKDERGAFDYSAMYEDNLLEMLYDGVSKETEESGVNSAPGYKYTDGAGYEPEYSNPHTGGSMKNRVTSDVRTTDDIKGYCSEIGLYSMMDVDHYKGGMSRYSPGDDAPWKISDAPPGMSNDPWIEIDWNPKPEKYVLYSNPKDVLDKFNPSTTSFTDSNENDISSTGISQKKRREDKNHMGQTQGENKIHFTDYSFAGLEVVHENMLKHYNNVTIDDTDYTDYTKNSTKGKTYDKLGSQFILIPGSRVFLPPQEGESGYGETEQKEAFFHKNMVKYWYGKEVDIRDSFQIVNLRCLPKWFLDYVKSAEDFDTNETEWLNKSGETYKFFGSDTEIKVSGSKPNYGQDDFLYLSSLSYDFNMMDMDKIFEMNNDKNLYKDVSKPFYNPNNVEPGNKNYPGYHTNPGSLGCYSFGIPVNFNKEYPTTAGRYYVSDSIEHLTPVTSNRTKFKPQGKWDIDNDACFGLWGNRENDKVASIQTGGKWFDEKIFAGHGLNNPIGANLSMNPGKFGVDGSPTDFKKGNYTRVDWKDRILSPNKNKYPDGSSVTSGAVESSLDLVMDETVNKRIHGNESAAGAGYLKTGLTHNHEHAYSYESLMSYGSYIRTGHDDANSYRYSNTRNQWYPTIDNQEKYVKDDTSGFRSGGSFLDGFVQGTTTVESYDFDSNGWQVKNFVTRGGNLGFSTTGGCGNSGYCPVVIPPLLNHSKDWMMYPLLTNDEYDTHTTNGVEWSHCGDSGPDGLTGILKADGGDGSSKSEYRDDDLDTDGGYGNTCANPKDGYAYIEGSAVGTYFVKEPVNDLALNGINFGFSENFNSTNAYSNLAENAFIKNYNDCPDPRTGKPRAGQHAGLYSGSDYDKPRALSCQSKDSPRKVDEYLLNSEIFNKGGDMIDKVWSSRHGFNAVNYNFDQTTNDIDHWAMLEDVSNYENTKNNKYCDGSRCEDLSAGFSKWSQSNYGGMIGTKGKNVGLAVPTRNANTRAEKILEESSQDIINEAGGLSKYYTDFMQKQCYGPTGETPSLDEAKKDFNYTLRGRRLTRATRTKLERELGSWSKGYPSDWMNWIQQCVTIETHPRSNDSNLWTFVPVDEEEKCDTIKKEVSTWGCVEYPSVDIYEGMDNIRDSQMNDNIRDSQMNDNIRDSQMNDNIQEVISEINDNSLNQEINKSKHLLIIIIFMCLFILILFKCK